MGLVVLVLVVLVVLVLAATTGSACCSTNMLIIHATVPAALPCPTSSQPLPHSGSHAHPPPLPPRHPGAPCDRVKAQHLQAAAHARPVWQHSHAGAYAAGLQPRGVRPAGGSREGCAATCGAVYRHDRGLLRWVALDWHTFPACWPCTAHVRAVWLDCLLCGRVTAALHEQ
jgi:hypothetical protein